MREKINLAGILKNEVLLENGIILFFILAVLFLNISQPYEHRISHISPAYYNANDNFWNGYVQPQHIKEVGGFIYEPSYAYGGYTDVIGYYPPLLNHLSAMISILSGIETYDITYLIADLFYVMGAVLIYYIIRRYSKEIALLSIPFMIGVFNFDFEIAHAFGLWMFLAGIFFLAAIIWAADRLNERHAAILLAILLSGAAFTHISEAIFAIGFLAAYALLRRIKEGSFDKAWLKNASMGLIIFLFLSAYYLVIFKYTWTVGVPYRFEVMDAAPFAPNFGVKISDFGVTLLLIVGGVLLGLKRIAFRKKEEFPFTAVSVGLFILAMGYTNYIGFGIRAWQIRIAWPIFFAVFSGILLYSISKKFIKSLNFMQVALISILLILSFSYLHEGKLEGEGIIDKSGWDALMWVKQNTSADSKIVYFYGSLASQSSSLWSSGRVPYIVNTEEYIDSGNKGIVKSNYSVAPFFDASGKLPYRKSFFDYGYYMDEPSKKMEPLLYERADYYFIPIAGKAAGNPAVAEYNLAIRSSLLKQPDLKEAYNSGDYSIIKREL